MQIVTLKELKQRHTELLITAQDGPKEIFGIYVRETFQMQFMPSPLVNYSWTQGHDLRALSQGFFQGSTLAPP